MLLSFPFPTSNLLWSFLTLVGDLKLYLFRGNSISIHYFLKKCQFPNDSTFPGTRNSSCSAAAKTGCAAPCPGLLTQTILQNNIRPGTARWRRICGHGGRARNFSTIHPAIRTRRRLARCPCRGGTRRGSPRYPSSCRDDRRPGLFRLPQASNAAH